LFTSSKIRAGLDFIANNKQSSQKRDSAPTFDSAPLTEQFDGQLWFANVSIGTPPQIFTGLLASLFSNDTPN
jgi:hypothetical protein